MSGRGARGLARARARGRVLAAAALLAAAAAGRAPAQETPPAAPPPHAPQREPELYLDQASVEAAGGLVRLERPDEEWLFIDIDVQRAQLMRERPAAEVEAAFRGVSARLHHPGLRATLSVYSFDLEGAKDLDAIEVEVRAELAARASRVLDLARGQLAGRLVLKADYLLEPKPPAAGSGSPPPDPLFVSRIDCPRPEPGKRIVLLFEVPKERRRVGQQALKDILKKLSW